MPRTHCQALGYRLTRLAARNSTTSILLICAICLGIGWGLSRLHPPTPRVHDEFSYLVAADTFVEGRLTNPPHPMWQHFETMHVIHQPTYASKYPPGQGMMLALGQSILDQPIAGVWLMTALGVLAVFWMLRGFLPARWAVIGACLLLLLPGYQIDWGQSYWGGTLASVGGALVLGAIPRLQRSLHIRDALALACGSLLLAVTRPFEGVILCVLAGGWLVVGWVRQGWPAWRPLLLQVLVPMFAVIAAGAWGLASYNYAVTGSPTTLPYQVHDETYGLCPLFLWQTPHSDRQYRHPVLAKFHREWELPFYHSQQSWHDVLLAKWTMLQVVGKHLLPLVVAIPLLWLPWWRGRKLREPMIVLCLFWLFTQVTIWNLPHYLAPGLPLIILVVVFGLRNLSVATRHTDWPMRPVTLLIFGQLLLFIATAWRYSNLPRTDWQYVREAIQETLSDQPGKQLVFVSYDENHNALQEWVYNRADIDAADIVWARMMSPEQDRALVEYFADRTVWLLKADKPQPELVPYQYPYD